MNTYTCHKRVRAKLMTRGAYNKLRGWTVPDDENPDDDGYLVEYIDGGQANVPGFMGYVSWSPTDVFERGYTEDAGPSPTGRPAHEQRVFDEQAELLDRVRKLRAFIGDKLGHYKRLPFAEQCRLTHQEELMTELAVVLSERIAAFTPNQLEKQQ